ncbi:MAG: hypothetical protein CL878_14460 [Dehalococcoidia bacterium]|nr:hypothetical protein [Dehalococcoidia bacterium]
MRLASFYRAGKPQAGRVASPRCGPACLLIQRADRQPLKGHQQADLLCDLREHILERQRGAHVPTDGRQNGRFALPLPQRRLRRHAGGNVAVADQGLTLTHRQEVDVKPPLRDHVVAIGQGLVAIRHPRGRHVEDPLRQIAFERLRKGVNEALAPQGAEIHATFAGGLLIHEHQAQVARVSGLGPPDHRADRLLLEDRGE